MEAQALSGVSNPVDPPAGLTQHLFDMRPATQFIPNESGWFTGGRTYLGANPEFGAYINYYLKGALTDDVRITITDTAGKVVRELTGSKAAGLNRVVWDLRTAPAAPATIGFYFQPELTNLGPFVLPGDYRVKLSAGGVEQTRARSTHAQYANDRHARDLGPTRRARRAYPSNSQYRSHSRRSQRSALASCGLCRRAGREFSICRCQTHL